ncbi:DNA repair protein RAD5B [Salvia divinorum]|uniref:DNA repair protein RAD5B n=1 Tax=Salvia divinorum TaxID=28513 RepID=A0ABD1HT40_SALDI
METTLTRPEPLEAKVKIVKSMVSSEVPVTIVLKALSLSNNNVCEAIDIILDSLQLHLAAWKTLTSTGGTRVQVIYHEVSGTRWRNGAF